ncbi:MAG TPA: amidohydrolase family protein [Acidimicrobiales bacterium]|nr:amidohydrolase family protein [Acidimicrobiales bacterium]
MRDDGDHDKGVEMTGDADRYLIVTSDAHAGAPMAGYKPYLPAAWHDEFDAWLAGVVMPWVDVNDTTNWDNGARLAQMDADGVTAEVIFPNTLPPFFDILAHLSGVPRDREAFARKWAGLQAHNRWLEDFSRDGGPRRRGIAQLLPNDIDAAVAEVRWAAGTGVMAGVMLPAVPPNHVVEPYFHPRYDPLWAACTETGQPVHQHQGTGAPDVGADVPVGWTIFFTELETWARRTMHHLIVGGVFERHPALQVVWTEMWGLRWVVEELASMTLRLRNVQSRFAGAPGALNYARTFGSPTVDALSLSPLEYFRRNCSIGASMLPRHDVRFCQALGTDRIMWGTDAPHPEGSAPHTTAALRTTLFDVPVEDCRAMLGLNAAARYGFDLGTLMPVAARIGPFVDEVATPLAEPLVLPGVAFAPEDPLEALLS